jgi:hypothetical protein
MMIPIRSVGAENSEYDYSEFQRAKNQAVKYLNSKLAIGVPIASYETKIPSMKNAAYTYDNALTHWLISQKENIEMQRRSSIHWFKEFK